jgi:hypothetical protein
MPVSINNTTLTFNNGTTQTTAPVNTNANVNSVSAGTGISVSATTGALTVNNTGVTSVNGQTGAVSVASSSGTVTSVATGNGLQGGTITSSGTLSVACPNFNTVGSYAFVTTGVYSINLSSGGNYSAGQNTNAFMSGALVNNCGLGPRESINLSGTWKWMGCSGGFSNATGIACRVS